jgi:toxin CptA
MKSVPAIAFDYRPSRRLLLAVAAGTALAVVSILVCGLSLWPKLGQALLTAIYAAWSAWRLWHPQFVQIAWHSAGHWRLRDAQGREHPGELAHATVLGVLIILAMRTHGKRTSTFVLLPDNCDDETRRKLRVRLARADSLGTHR